MGSTGLFILILTFVCLSTTPVESQSCFFTGGSEFLFFTAGEKDALGVKQSYTSAVINSITDVTPNEYFNLVYDEIEKRLDVVLDTSLAGYFRDISNGESIRIEFIAVCDGGITQETILQINVDDTNDPPDFDAPDTNFEFTVQFPRDLSVPINWDTDAFAVDWDWKEEFAEHIVFSTSQPDIVEVRGEKLWSDSTERPRRYSLKIKLLTQVDEDFSFNLIATNDALAPVEQEVVITVDRLNIFPPTFSKHLYRSVIDDFPKKDDVVQVDGGPISALDKEGNAFDVTTTSPLIDISCSSVTGICEVVFKVDITEDILRELLEDHGVGVFDLTAKESASTQESSTVLLLFFTKALELDPTPTSPTPGTSVETSVTPGTTDATTPGDTSEPTSETQTTNCPEVSTACPETPPTVTVCPEFSTTCPESTVIFTETQSTNCPEVSTACPETPPTVCPEFPSTCPESTVIFTESPPTACPEITTSIITACPDTPATACPVTACPEITSSTTECNCESPATKELPVTECPICETQTNEPCPPLPGDGDDSNIGYIVGLVVLGVLLLLALGAAVYFWRNNRRKGGNLLKDMAPTEPWVPRPGDISSDKPIILAETSPQESFYNPTFSMESEAPLMSNNPSPVVDPFIFGTRVRGSDELSEATNPQVETSIPEVQSAPIPKPIPTPVPVPEPDIPSPDYGQKKGIVFDERVEVKTYTPVPQEYVSDEEHKSKSSETNKSGEDEQLDDENARL